jgi:hypothetical protein
LYHIVDALSRQILANKHFFGIEGLFIGQEALIGIGRVEVTFLGDPRKICRWAETQEKRLGPLEAPAFVRRHSM